MFINRMFILGVLMVSGIMATKQTASVLSSITPQQDELFAESIGNDVTQRDSGPEEGGSISVNT